MSMMSLNGRESLKTSYVSYDFLFVSLCVLSPLKGAVSLEESLLEASRSMSSRHAHDYSMDFFTLLKTVLRSYYRKSRSRMPILIKAILPSRGVTNAPSALPDIC